MFDVWKQEAVDNNKMGPIETVTEVMDRICMAQLKHVWSNPLKGEIKFRVPQD
jgi:hypothetical protein